MDYIKLALKNIFKQRARSILAILAIVIGTTSVTIMLALVLGAKNFYYDQFKATGKLQQIAVTSQPGLDFQQSQRAANCDNCTRLTNNIADKIININHVTGLAATADLNIFESVSLNANKQGIVTAQGYQANGVINHIFVSGKNFNSNSGSGDLIISQDYADAWGYKNKYDQLIGKQVTLKTNSSFTGEGAQLPNPIEQFKQCQAGCQAKDVAQQQPTNLNAHIVGVESDTTKSIYVPLKWAQQLLTTQRYEITDADQAAYTTAYDNWKARGQRGTEPLPNFTLVRDDQLGADGYSTFVVRVDNSNNAEAVAAQIQKLGVGSATAKSYVQDQLQVFNIIGFILAGMGSITLIVAAISIINTMIMAVLEQTREIGVMRALGAPRSNVSRLFTLEASALGLLGGILGVAIGYGLILLANVFINIQLADNSVSARNIITVPLWLALLVIIVTTVIGMLAGLYPARRAARLDPVEALRRE